MRPLAPRQRQVCELLAAGEATSDKELAAALGISEGTAHNHLMGAYRVAGVRTRIALVRWWIANQTPPARFGWLRPMPEHRRGHSPECGCSVCFVHGRQDRRQAA